MQRRYTIKRELLLTDIANQGLNLQLLNHVCDTVENMNDDHLIGVVVDTLLDIRDILMLEPGKIVGFKNEIEARFNAVNKNTKLFEGYGMMQNSMATIKLERLNQLKNELDPLINSAIQLRTIPHHSM